MKKNKKREKIYLLILLIIAVFATNFVSAMGFLNYRTAVIDLEEQVIERVEKNTVSDLETSLSFGKSFENYYGMDEIFNSFSKQIEGPVPFVIDNDNALLYSAAASRKETEELLSFFNSEVFAREKSSFARAEGGKIELGPLKAILSPIHRDDRIIGYFGCIYSEKIFNKDFTSVIKKILLLDLIIMIAECIALAAFVYFSEKETGKKIFVPEVYESVKKLSAVLIMTLGIIVLSGASLYIYQEDYNIKMTDSIRASLEDLEIQISRVENQGVNLKEVDGLEDYIRKHVTAIETLHDVRITECISEVKLTDEKSNLITYRFVSGEKDGGKLYLEAEMSDDVIGRKIREITLVLLSTMIILLIFVFEMNNLVELLTRGPIEEPNRKNLFSEKQVSLALRFTGFLCSTAEYMCLPYTAMMIRERGETIFGLSVGMTAALPLTLEWIFQIAGMFILPRYVKKFNVKAVLVFSSVLMVACNVTTVIIGGALTIIVCRALAGLSYAGFKQVSNYLITRGYETETGRSENISQDNAGLLAGTTCGAGLGAILSANAGYPVPFLCSAVLFAAYLLITMLVIPWKGLALRGNVSEEEKPVIAKDIIKILLSTETLLFILVIALPLNIGVMLCVTLIPAICQTKGISSVILSYCYIANGLGGIYIGPALVSGAKKRFGLKPSISFAFALTALGLFVLHVPPVVVMIILTSMILGFLDGFTTPLYTDQFISLRIVRNTVDESTALIFSVILSYVLLTFAPMIAELLLLPGKGMLSPLMIAILVYAAVAAVLLVPERKQ